MIGTPVILDELRRAILRRLPTPHQRNRVASKIGINRTYMCQIASGKNQPLALMLRIADYLGISVEMRIDGRDLSVRVEIERERFRVAS